MSQLDRGHFYQLYQISRRSTFPLSWFLLTDIDSKKNTYYYSPKYYGIVDSIRVSVVITFVETLAAGKHQDKEFCFVSKTKTRFCKVRTCGEDFSTLKIF